MPCFICGPLKTAMSLQWKHAVGYVSDASSCNACQQLDCHLARRCRPLHVHTCMILLRALAAWRMLLHQTRHAHMHRMLMRNAIAWDCMPEQQAELDRLRGGQRPRRDPHHPRCLRLCHRQLHQDHPPGRPGHDVACAACSPVRRSCAHARAQARSPLAPALFWHALLRQVMSHLVLCHMETMHHALGSPYGLSAP